MRTQPPPARRRGPVAQLRYRVGQFVGARLARVDPVDRAALLRAARVPPTLIVLFGRMPVPYQWHALNVARRLQAAGHTDPILLQAALLHDMGKWDPATNARVTLFVRSAIVLLQHLPGGGRVVRYLGSGPPPPRSLRYAWYLQLNHPRLSAALAAQGGARREAVELIREHDRPAPPLPAAQRARLIALQAADDES